jgi:hypothetical protein
MTHYRPWLKVSEAGVLSADELWQHLAGDLLDVPGRAARSGGPGEGRLARLSLIELAI